MSTLKERFAEKFHTWVHPYVYVDGKSEPLDGCFLDIRGQDVASMSADILSFIQAELLLLAEEVDNQETWEDPAALIRSKATELI